MSGTYAWAEDILSRIQCTVERTQRATPAQWTAVAEIRKSERTPSRNYDVYGYGRRD